MGTNPNRSPFELLLTGLTADAYSLDREAEDEVGEVIYLGQDNLWTENLAPDDETRFEMTIDERIVSAPLSTRLSRDCGSLSQGKTKLRIILKDVTFWE